MHERGATTPAAHPYRRFVALGDSQTEGIGDPDGLGGYRGWADRLAGELGAHRGDFRYANLAVRGLRAHEVRVEQLNAAQDCQPDLATVVAGMNDLIRPRFDRAKVLAELETIFAGMTATGAHVVTFTFPDIGAIAPLVRPLSRRVREMNAAVRTLAARHGVTVVDFEPVQATPDRRVWCEDRLHLNPLGHQLASSAVADALSLPGSDDRWRDPLAPMTAPSKFELIGDEMAWTARHLAPWVRRRVRGQSSSTGVVAKRPDMQAVRSVR